MADEKPIVLLDLTSACHSMDMVLFVANRFVPSERWNALAATIRPHIKAAAQVLRECANQNSQKLESWAGSEECIREIVLLELAPRLRSRRLLYYDSEGDLAELKVENGEFAGFGPAQ